MTRKSRLILFVVLVVAVLAGSWLVLRKPASAPTRASATAATGSANAGSRASLAVETVLPAQADWPVSLVANGALAAWQEATISAETGGLRITALHADVGTRVRRGQLLAELNGDTVKADLRKVEAAVASAQARLREAQANVRRGNAVRESGSLSGQQIEQYEIAQQTAAADLQSAQADLASVRIRLQQTRIAAVDDGVISARTATLGAVVSAGTELFRLQRDARVEWRAEVDALQLAQLRPGMPATVNLPGGATAEGRIRQLAPTLDDKTRNALVYVDLPKQEQIRAGIFVNGRFDLGQRSATVVPGTAVTLRDGRSYVFEVDRQRQTVQQREVVTGRSRGEQIEILSGVRANVPLVKTGGGFLNDGDAVRVSSEPRAAASVGDTGSDVGSITPLASHGGTDADVSGSAAKFSTVLSHVGSGRVAASGGRATGHGAASTAGNVAGKTLAKTAGKPAGDMPVREADKQAARQAGKDRDARAAAAGNAANDPAARTTSTSAVSTPAAGRDAS